MAHERLAPRPDRWLLSLLGLLFLSCTATQPAAAQSPDPHVLPEPIEVERDYPEPPMCFSKEEKELYKALMQYRHEHHLPRLKVSEGLTQVAKLHCWDMEVAHPDTGVCNMHSWSSGDARWSPCCYTSDHANAECIWNKVQEITGKPAVGYEISFTCTGCTPEMMVEYAMKGWQSSPSHDNTILNKEIWEEPWAAIGLGITEHYATVWFSNESLGDRQPSMCH